MQFASDFSDQAVLLPVCVLVAFWLGWTGRRNALAAWGVVIGGGLGLLLLLKLAAAACDWRSGLLRLGSPSGHVGAGALVYGGLVVLGWPWLARASRIGTAPPTPVPGRWRAGRAALIGAGVGVVFGATRLALGVHSVADVSVGIVIGAAGCAALGGWPQDKTHRVWPGRDLATLAVLLLMASLLHGRRMGAERAIDAAALQWLRPSCLGGGQPQLRP